MSDPNYPLRSFRSSNWRTPRSRAANTSLNASAPAFEPPISQAQALEALLAFGSVRINVTAEREDIAASPDRPCFLKGVHYDPTDTCKWYKEVLPFLSKCTFVISSTADVTYSADIFGSEALPHIHNAVTKIELPKFYWFNGITLNRHHNPYLQMCRNLPNLRELSLTIHTAGLTTQRWAERQAIALEQKDPEAARERILLPPLDVVHRYELDALFACGDLCLLRLKYIESDMTAYFCKYGSPLDVLHDIKTYLNQGFVQRGLRVIVDLVRIEEASLG